MLSAHGLEQRLRQIKALPRPVLSIYAETGDPRDGFVSEAAHIRVREVLRRLRAQEQDPIQVGKREPDKLLLDAIGHPSGRGTVAIFAGPVGPDANGKLGRKVEVVPWVLPMVLPVGDNTLAAEAQVGEPWLMPLRLALSETDRSAIVHAHDRGVSVYEVFLAEIDHILELTPPSMPGEFDRLERSKTIHPAHIADRGSAAFDDAEHHRVAWRRRFYTDAAADLVPMLAARSVDTMLLIGTPPNRQLFGEVAPQALLARQIGEGPGLPQQDARPAQILASVRDLLDEHLHARKLALLAKLSEHGIVGIDDCLTRLQRGQLERLFVPWDLDRELFVELDTGQVATSPGQARALSGDGHSRVAPVRARGKLVELADRYSTQVEFVRAGASKSPFDAIQGVAGLPRWTV